MSLSLNETYKLTKDAARGAGLSWGCADELAQATVWLEVAGLPGCGSAVGVLDDASDAAAPIALHSNGGWSVEAVEPDAVTSSTLAATCARDIAMSTVAKSTVFEPVTLVGLRWPLVGLGVLAKVVPAAGDQVLLRATDTAGHPVFEAVVRTSGVWFGWRTDNDDHSASLERHSIKLTRETETSPSVDTRCIWTPTIRRNAAETGLTPDPAALKFLRRYARACLVPATEESRLKGAGAGTVDRD